MTNRFGDPGPGFTQGNTKPYREMIEDNLRGLRIALHCIHGTMLRNATQNEIMKNAFDEIERKIKASEELLK